MGLTFTKLFQRLFSKKEMRILMVRAGRTNLTKYEVPTNERCRVNAGGRLSFLPCLGRRLAGVSGEGGWRRRRDAFGDPTGVTSRGTDDGCDQDVANAALDADHAAGSDTFSPEPRSDSCFLFAGSLKR